MAHKNPGQVLRLISRLNDGTSEFFIHIDSKVDIAPFKILEGLGNVVHFTERFDAKWGSLGTIKPFLSCMKAVQQSNKNFDRVLLLSGQDYPIKSNEYINNFFSSNGATNFINHFPIPNYDKWPGSDRGGLYRVDKYFFGLKWHEFLCSKSLNLLSSIVPFINRKIPCKMKPYTGQTWWNLDMNAINYILDFNERHPEYIKFHKSTFVADELFVQMILLNSNNENLIGSISNTELRFTIWEAANSAHPKFLRADDLESIMAAPDLFARKFDELIDSEILDLIDHQILFKQVAA